MNRFLLRSSLLSPVVLLFLISVSFCKALPKAHAERQVEILKNAFRLLRVGGALLYSTCALSQAENDEVTSSSSPG